MRIEELNAYEIIGTTDLTDIHAAGTLVRHKKSGARLALVSTEDDNKVFSIAFRTPPEDSTGVAHILEHSVLCGSKHFPLKDPFIELAKGSLNTFLNAMTYPDKTVYPVASCNAQDFQNLMHIYLDAVFYPNVYKNEEIFKKEGWSYELEDRNGELNYNGVVYNEMKGAFSSPEGVLDREIVNSLYPDTCYGVESGGDPKHIPELTYEQFLDFHRRYYHPCNSYIYLYGDMDMAEKLDFIDREYLSNFSAISLDSEIPLQKAFSEMADKTLPYPVSDSEPLTGNTFLSWQKVIGETSDIRRMLAFDVLDYALMSSPGAPLEKALLDAGIGKDVYGTLETDLRQPFFSVVAKNADVSDRDRFVSVVEETLREQAEKGISEKALLAGINYEEFRAREADYGRYPKGLLYGLSMLCTWLYDDAAPFTNLQVMKEYAWLRTQTKTGYFEGLIRELLLSNPHGSVLCLVPERGLSAKRDRAVKEELDRFRAGLSGADLDRLAADTAALRAYQTAEDAPEDIAKIPMLSRSDLRREVRPVHIEEAQGSEKSLLYSEEETNGIGYLQFLFSLDGMAEELVPFFGILQGVLGMVDTERFTYDELPHEINLHTGGVESDLAVYMDFGEKESERYTSVLKFRGKALYDELPSVFSLVKEIALTSKLTDEKRIREILAQGKSRLSTKFLTAGHQTAVLRASAYDGGAALFKEYTEGISFYRILKDLDEHFPERKETLYHILENLMQVIFTKRRLMIHFTGNRDAFSKIEPEAAVFADALPQIVNEPALLAEASELAGELLMASKTDIRPSGNEGFVSASGVQYVARTGNFDRIRYPFNGSMQVLRTIMNYDYLWNCLREQGGAYGCMSMLGRDGRGYFVSYRDPHLTRTNRVYDGIVPYLQDFRADERAMTKYIIGTLSTLDLPLSPEQRGARSLTYYLTHADMEEMQEERNQVLDASEEDIRALAGPVSEILSANHVCVIGGEEKIRENESFFEKIVPLM